MVDPSDKQQKDYEFLLTVEDAILDKLKEGKSYENDSFGSNRTL